VTIAERQQGQKTGPLDRRRQLTLELDLGARNPAGYDLAGLGQVLLKQVEILVIDYLSLFRGKSAELSTFELTCHLKNPRYLNFVIVLNQLEELSLLLLLLEQQTQRFLRPPHREFQQIPDGLP